VSFTDRSEGDITSRLWNFGDGTSGSWKNMSHTYTAGTYTAALTVTGPGGMVSKTVIVTVTEPGIGH